MNTHTNETSTNEPKDIQKASCETGSCGCVTRREASSTGWTYRPDVDVIDAGEAFILTADVPGATADSIDVTLEDGVLSIQARVEPRTQTGTGGSRREFGVGNYHRRFRFEDDLDADRISADYTRGVLTLRLPKTRPAARRIPINVG